MRQVHNAQKQGAAQRHPSVQNSGLTTEAPA